VSKREREQLERIQVRALELYRRDPIAAEALLLFLTRVASWKVAS
jgi:hypothetical protein